MLRLAKSKNTIRRSAVARRKFSYQYKFDSDVVMKLSAVATLKRGLKKQDMNVIFHPYSWLGFPSRKALNQPLMVDANNIVLHKDSLLVKDYYFSATNHDETAAKFGPIRMVFDATHPHHWVDVDTTYTRVVGQYPEKYEYEKVSLGPLLCALAQIEGDIAKGITSIDSPFYLKIDVDNMHHVSQYNKVNFLYHELLLASNPLSPSHDQARIPALIKAYVNEKLALFDLVQGKDNVFNLTRREFGNRFPAYTRMLCQHSAAIPEFSSEYFFGTRISNVLKFNFLSPQRQQHKKCTMRDIFMSLSVSLFMNHPYTKKIG